MKRDWLRNLGVAEDLIGQIMDENGKDINAAKGNLDALNQSVTAKDTEISGLREQLAQRDSDIKGLRDGAKDAESIRAQLAELQAKYTTDTKALNDKLTQQATAFARSTATDKFFSGVEFSSELAKRAAVAEFNSAALELKDGAFVGAGEWLDKLRKDSPDAFKTAPQPEQPKEQLPRFGGPINNLNQQGEPKGMFNFNFTPIRNMNPNK